MRLSRLILTAAALLGLAAADAQRDAASASWQEEFDIASCKLLTTGRNQYFIMEPGFQLILEGDGDKLQVTVLEETKEVDGVTTRVIEEREWKDGALYEISRNYFAMCDGTKDVFYFGEAVDFFEGKKTVRHDGSWLAGNGNKAGLIMAGNPKVGQKYYQEIAPDVAMDRAEIISLDETCETPAGKFARCLKVKEGTALNIFETEYKYYAPGIGLIADQDLRLTKYGFR